MRQPKFSRRAFIAGGLTALGVSTGLYGFWWEPSWLVTRRLSVGAHKRAHRLVHLTDVHYGGDRSYLERVVSAINDLGPDLVCFTGDILDDARFLPEALQVMGRIRAPLYGVPGNHDYWAGIDFQLVARSFAATGGKWLMDENALFRDGQVNIMGATCTKAPAIQPVAGLKNVLLFHYPEWVQKLSGLQFDLMLAGHSHGGQVRLPLYGPVLTPFGAGDFDKGLYQTAAGPLYVNPGIGCFYVDVRFCCRPEITWIEF